MIKKLLIKTTNESSMMDEVAMLILRVGAGLFMAFGHGKGKVPPSEGFVQGVSAMGFPFPEMFAWAAGLTEFIGGILLAIGLFTRPSAFFLAITMFVACFIRHGADPLNVKEMSALYLMIYIIFAVKGSSKFSVDNIIK